MKTIRHVLACAALATSASVPAADFGVMETADFIQTRHFKFLAYPIFARAQPTQEQNMGVTVGAGYGIGSRWDVEGLFVNYDDASLFGSDIEYTWFDGASLDASLSIGAHGANTDFGDQVGGDLTQIVSWWVPRVPRLALSAALDFAYDDLDRTKGAVNRGMAEDWWSAYVVPGVQYRLTQRVDLFGEVGLGLNDDSRDYTSGGLSIYFE
jgi:hypothetical protein